MHIRSGVGKLGAATFLVATALLGQHFIPSAVPASEAACFVGWPGCFMDPTRTSTLKVTHLTTGLTPDKVSPQSSDVWNVTAYYSPAGAPCTDATYNAQVTVTNTGSAFSVSCTGCTTAPFNGVALCDANTCANGFEYIIQLNMNTFEPGPALGQITKVDYSSASIDDGVIVNSDCSTGASVSPTSQSWAASDTTFPCSLDCTNDTALTIFYQ